MPTIPFIPSNPQLILSSAAEYTREALRFDLKHDSATQYGWVTVGSVGNIKGLPGSLLVRISTRPEDAVNQIDYVAPDDGDDVSGLSAETSDNEDKGSYEICISPKNHGFDRLLELVKIGVFPTRLHVDIPGMGFGDDPFGEEKLWDVGSHASLQIQGYTFLYDKFEETAKDEETPLADEKIGFQRFPVVDPALKAASQLQSSVRSDERWKAANGFRYTDSQVGIATVHAREDLTLLVSLSSSLLGYMKSALLALWVLVGVFLFEICARFI
jgi:hypothetical protein